MDGSAGRCTDDCGYWVNRPRRPEVYPSQERFSPGRGEARLKRGAGFAGARCWGGEALVAHIEDPAREQDVFDPKGFRKDWPREELRGEQTGSLCTSAAGLIWPPSA